MEGAGGELNRQISLARKLAESLFEEAYVSLSREYTYEARLRHVDASAYPPHELVHRNQNLAGLGLEPLEHAAHLVRRMPRFLGIGSGG